MSDENKESITGAFIAGLGLGRSRLHATIRDLHDSMDRFRVNDMAKMLYDFVWHDFCDWYIELIKDRLYSDDVQVQKLTLQRALHVYDGILSLLHPVMPFITEELWQQVAPVAGRTNKVGAGGTAQQTVMLQTYPTSNPERVDATAEAWVATLKSLVTACRSLRGSVRRRSTKRMSTSARRATCSIC